MPFPDRGARVRGLVQPRVTSGAPVKGRTRGASIRSSGPPPLHIGPALLAYPRHPQDRQVVYERRCLSVPRALSAGTPVYRYCDDVFEIAERPVTRYTGTPEGRKRFHLARVPVYRHEEWVTGFSRGKGCDFHRLK